MKSIKLVFAGTPISSVHLLNSIVRNPDIIIKSVLTQPDKPIGRCKKLIPSPVKIFAQNNNINFLTPASLKNELFIEKFTKINPDILIIANYAKIIPSKILKIPKYGTICFHPSLLPKYRGPTPIQTVLLENKKNTGITFFLMDEKIDHGPILFQKKVGIYDKDTTKTLMERMFQLGAKNINTVVKNHIESKITPIPQQHSHATFTKKITRNDGFIETSKHSDNIIWNKYRAYYPWPGIWTIWKGKRLKINELDHKNDQLIVKKVQLEGKKELSYKEFLNGYPDFDLL